MFSLLLPLDASAERHSVNQTEPSAGFWARMLRAVRAKVLQLAPARL